MDLSHAVPFSPSPTKVWSGSYADCKDADLVVITADYHKSQVKLV